MTRVCAAKGVYRACDDGVTEHLGAPGPSPESFASHFEARMASLQAIQKHAQLMGKPSLMWHASRDLEREEKRAKGCRTRTAAACMLRRTSLEEREASCVAKKAARARQAAEEAERKKEKEEARERTKQAARAHALQMEKTRAERQLLLLERQQLRAEQERAAREAAEAARKRLREELE